MELLEAREHVGAGQSAAEHLASCVGLQTDATLVRWSGGVGIPRTLKAAVTTTNTTAASKTRYRRSCKAIRTL